MSNPCPVPICFFTLLSILTGRNSHIFLTLLSSDWQPCMESYLFPDTVVPWLAAMYMILTCFLTMLSTDTVFCHNVVPWLATISMLLTCFLTLLSPDWPQWIWFLHVSWQCCLPTAVMPMIPTCFLTLLSTWLAVLYRIPTCFLTLLFTWLAAMSMILTCFLTLLPPDWQQCLGFPPVS